MAGTTEFPQQVRALRHAAGLTQAELAERSGISERTVSDLERGLRAGVYPATARRLAAALQVSSEALPAFLVAARGPEGQVGAASAASLVAADQRAGLPVPLTALLGREFELETLLGLIRDGGTRLITVVGLGGIGKTRLAVEAAAHVAADFPGGVRFIDVASLDDASSVLPAIASAFGVDTSTGDVLDALSRVRAKSRTLVVLDTFERVTAGGAAVGAMVAGCPWLTVLVTSRVALRIRGERELPLQPLPLLSGGPDSALLSPAVQLFIERATAVRPDFDRSATEAVAQICSSLDGLPLAIELAAARVKHMPVRELRFKLERRLDSLVSGAQDLPAGSRPCAPRWTGATRCSVRARCDCSAPAPCFVAGSTPPRRPRC